MMPLLLHRSIRNVCVGGLIASCFCASFVFSQGSLPDNCNVFTFVPFTDKYVFRSKREREFPRYMPTHDLLACRNDLDRFNKIPNQSLFL